MSAPLEARNVRRALGGRPVVDGVDLAVEAGTIHALVGLNGAGKTTLMRLLLGMQAADAGEAWVLGAVARTAPPAVWSGVGHLVETPFCYPELTARENLRAAAMLQRLRPDAEPAIEVLARRLRFDPWLDRRASTLSLGTRQKVALAAAMLHGPRVLVLDEPGNALDPLAVLRLRELLRERADAGAAVLLSSHHLDELARVADRVSVLHRGRIAGELDADGPDIERRFFDLLVAVDSGRDDLDEAS